MPEHVHLLVSEPERGVLANAIQSFKIASAKRIGLRKSEVEQGSLWQRRYYDRNVRDYSEFMEKLHYIH